jgi:hypothetical protein
MVRMALCVAMCVACVSCASTRKNLARAMAGQVKGQLVEAPALGTAGASIRL